MLELVKDETQDKQPSAIQNNHINSNINSSSQNQLHQINHEMLNWSAIGDSKSSNFETCQLELVSPNRIELVETSHSKWMKWVFLGLGICLFVGFIIGLVNGDTNWVLLFCALGFSSTMLFLKHQSAVVDKSMGWYWVGPNKYTKPTEIQNIKKKGRIAKILAVQVLADYVTDSDGDYYCYELNFIVENGRRRNFMRHGGHDEMSRDGKLMAKFLNVPYFERLSYDR